MSREAAIAAAEAFFDKGQFKSDLTRAVSVPTESQNPDRAADLTRYLQDIVTPMLAEMGFKTRILQHPKAKGPFLFAERIEDPSRPTILGYGHGDVIRGLDADWKSGLSPWELVERDGRWWGRGVVDNKGQHLLNFAAQKAVLAARGKLGFNAKWLIEMGEELGSPGLKEACEAHKDLLAADLLIASDGPRVSAERPTLFLGARGAMLVDLLIEAREGGHHSGNWGGLISNPGILLAHAIASLVGPNGQIRIPEMVPAGGIPDSVREALADIEVDGGPGAPEIETWWGEPGLTSAEKVYGWCNFEVLAYETGNPKTPVNAIPPRAWARCQLRHVVGIDQAAVLPAIRRHLDRQGLGMVQVLPGRDNDFIATRLDPRHPWAQFAARSLQRSTNMKPAVLPNLGGALPNEVFSDLLGLPTVWVPHSYPGCSQHAPNEHVPVPLVRQALGMMAGLYWDLGELEGKAPV
ncbi:MAG: M20 peptidase family dipeptidase [Hyphomicrobiales bacterium]|nr:MAG: M20 peptidase family dipeptidase [Hyphomicrobiales bacterium]